MRVSVVVPVFNTGRYIVDLIDSLRAQTLDAAEFEVLFVDDGSTDDTPALLDAAAAETANFRVIHTPNSGWPGRPRNIGLDGAQGDYVFLSDHDDRLAPDALEVLTDFASAHDSDVVIGKIIGVDRSAPARIFARTEVDAQQDLGLLMTSLTPQKLYRRAFLEEQGIRFPEGKRRLEDHLFVTKAYLRAKRVSVYADRPVYYFVLRDDGRNASRRKVEWPGYYANAAESVAVVDAEAPDDATRVVMRSRWLRTEALKRMHGRGFLERPDRAELLAAVGGFLRDHYPVEEIDRLPPPDRLVGRLLLDGRDDDVVQFAAWEDSLEVVVTIGSAELAVASGAAAVLVLQLEAARVVSDLPTSLQHLPDGYPQLHELGSVARIADRARLAARLRHEDERIELEVEHTVENGVLRGTAVLDPAGTSKLTEGRWQVRATVRGLGRPWTSEPFVGSNAAIAEGRPLTTGGLRLAVSVNGKRRLRLRVERISVGRSVRLSAVRVVRKARSVLGRAATAR